MNKILNWTFGACFRTLGRFLAIFLVGILLVFIGSKLGLEWLPLLTMRVNASDNYIENWSDGLTSNYRVDFRGCDTEKGPNANGQYECNTNDANTNASTNTFSTGSGIREFVTNNNAWSIGQNGYAISLAYRTKKNYLYNINYYYCSNTYINDYTDTFITLGTHAQKYQTNVFYEDNMKYIGNKPGSYNENYDGYEKTFTACYKLNALVVPQFDSGDITFRIRQSSGTITNHYHSFIALEVIEVGAWFAELENVIKNSGFATAESVEQVQQSVAQVQQEVTELNNAQQETNDTIKDTDTSDAENIASGFFDNFQIEDNGGISAIITAPLESIKAMLSTSCSPMTATFREKEISLPCGYDFWNKMGAIRNFLNLVLDGMLCYAIIRKLYLTIEKLKNPEEDKVEVMKL